MGKPVSTPTRPAARGVGASATTASPAKRVNGGAGAPTTSAGDDDKTLAADILTGILIEHEGAVSKKDLAKFAFQAAGAKVSEGALDAKAKTRIVQLVFQDSFLHELAEQGGIVFDGATVSLAT